MTSADIPPMPEGVVHVDGILGIRTKCSLGYDGRNERGQHVWAITTEDIVFDPHRGDSIEIALMPPRTTLAFNAFNAPQWMEQSNDVVLDNLVVTGEVEDDDDDDDAGTTS